MEKRDIFPSRRSFLKLVGSSGAALTLYPFLVDQAFGAVKTFRLGFLPRVMGPIVMGVKEAGPKHGIKLEVSPFFDTTKSMIAVGAGNIDGNNMTNQHIVRALDENLDVVLVCGLAAGWIVFNLLKEIPVEYGDFAALKRYIKERKRAGKPFKIGVPTGSYQHLVLTWKLREHGISLKDVQTLDVLFPRQPQIMKMKQIDMISTVSTFGAATVIGGYGKTFYYPYDVPSGKNHITLGVSGKAIKERPEFVQSAVSTFVEALKKINRYSPEQLLAKEVQYSKLPAPMMKLHLKDIKYDYRIDVADIRGAAKMMAQAGWTKRDLSGEVKRGVNFTFLKKATGQTEEELNRWTWKPKV